MRKVNEYLRLFLCLAWVTSGIWGCRADNTAPVALPSGTQERLRLLLNSPEVARGHVGLAIIALGRVASPQAFPSEPYKQGVQPLLMQVDAGRRFMPASNLKLYTAALALRELGAGHCFTTRVTAGGITPEGYSEELRLVGGGDPALSTGDLDQLATQVAARGIKQYGSLTVDDGLFRAETFGGRYPDGWTLDDTIWYYGAEVSALAINRNQVDVVVMGDVAGRAANIVMSPVSRQVTVDANVLTLASGAATTGIQFERQDDADGLGCRLIVRGNIAFGSTVTEGIAVPRPAAWAADLWRRALARHGVIQVAISPKGAAETSNLVEIARHESDPLGILLRRLLKNSDNLYAEMLLRAAVAPVSPGGSAAGAAHVRLRGWLRLSGIDDELLRFEDGSGLSRYNLITPLATAQMLAASEKLPGAMALWEGLPIAGVDGTLKTRLKETSAAGNARAKTGTFSIASTLSGYVTTRDGHRLAVSLLTNFLDTAAARRLQDGIYDALAASDLSAQMSGQSPAQAGLTLTP